MDIYEALVVDIITNETHPDYSSDGFNLGMAKLRFLREKNSLSDNNLYVAHPFDLNLCDFPLIGEVVLAYKISGKFHYSSKVSIAKNLNMNSAVGQNEIENARFGSENQTTSPTGEHLFTKTKEKFQFDETVFFLRPFPGDTIHQSRFGASIRFGSSLLEKGNKKLNPNLLISVGKDRNALKNLDTPYALIFEDVNLDATSIWLTSDQKVPFIPSTIDANSFLRSTFDTKLDLSGAQAIFVSDQIILNSKTKPIYLFSNKDVTVNARNNFIVDVDSKIYMTADVDINMKSGISIFAYANKNISANAGENIFLQGDSGVQIIGNKIFVGSLSDDAQPMVLGTELSKFFQSLITALLTAPIGFGTLGPVPMNPAIVAKLTALLTQLAVPNPGQVAPKPFAGAPFNSRDNFVTKENKLETF